MKKRFRRPLLRLPALPPGQQRLIVGNDVVLVERATGLILDVLRGALASR